MKNNNIFQILVKENTNNVGITYLNQLVKEGLI